MKQPSDQPHRLSNTRSSLAAVGGTLGIVALLAAGLYGAFRLMGAEMTETQDELCTLCAAVMLVGFALLLGVWLNTRYRARREEGCNVPVVARITAVRKWERRVNRSTSIDYFPTYTYYLDGEEISVECGLGSRNENDYTVGETVDLWVAPGHPERFKREDDDKRHTRPMLWAGMAIIAAGALGLLLLAASMGRL